MGLADAFGSVLPSVADLYFQKRGLDEQKETQDRNEALQREFATHGIRWRVEDAKAAGLHPLFALGASVPQYSPATAIDFSGMSNSLHTMGQNVSRAARASMTPEERTMLDLNMQEVRSRIRENDARAAAIESQMARDAMNDARNARPIPLSSSTVRPSAARARELRLPPGSMRTSETESAQTVQDEYGDIVENLYGASRLLNDLGMNFFDALEKRNPWWMNIYDAPKRESMEERFPLNYRK